MRVRRGFTLVELCVTLAVGGLVLLLVVAMGVREERTHENIGQLLSSLAPLREAASVLPVDLRALGRAAGEVLEASDTALDIQATIGGGVVCALTRTPSGVVSTLTLVPRAARNGELNSTSSLPELGDTVRVLSLGAGSERWASAAVREGRLVAGACATTSALALDADERVQHALVLSLLDSLPPSAVAPGSPVRVTRRERYAFYRASDGAWYLGLREWNGASSRFDGVQPLVGPFASPLAAGARFRYLDSLGAALASDQPRDVAAIVVDLVATVPRSLRSPAYRGVVASTRRETTTVIVSARNVPR